MATTAMRLTDEVTNYPNGTITGKSGTVVDTNVDVHWPAGPARVYLHPREIAEAVRVAHTLVEVADVLKAEGWIHRDEYQHVVGEATAAKDAAEAKAAELGQKLEAAISTINLIQTPAVEPPAPAKPKRTAKKTEATG